MLPNHYRRFKRIKRMEWIRQLRWLTRLLRVVGVLRCQVKCVHRMGRLERNAQASIGRPAEEAVAVLHVGA